MEWWEEYGPTLEQDTRSPLWQIDKGEICTLHSDSINIMIKTAQQYTFLL